MANHEQKAQELLAEARKKKTQGIFGGIFGSGGSDYEKKADLLTSAANQFKMAQRYEDAANVFIEISELYNLNGVKHEAISNYNNAAIAFLNVDVNKAVGCYKKALEIQVDQGKFSQAAKTHGDLGELIENNQGNMKAAAEHYELAKRYAAQENQKSTAYKYEQKYAAALANAGEYEKAASIYENCGAYSSSQNLLKYSAKDHLFHALLCYLLFNVSQANTKHKHFLEAYPTYQGTREAVLIEAVISAIDNENLNAFQTALKTFDKVTSFTPLCTSLLLKLKKDKFTDEEDVC